MVVKRASKALCLKTSNVKKKLEISKGGRILPEELIASYRNPPAATKRAYDENCQTKKTTRIDKEPRALEQLMRVLRLAPIHRELY